jgi:hypothetical protein
MKRLPMADRAKLSEMLRTTSDDKRLRALCDLVGVFEIEESRPLLRNLMANDNPEIAATAITSLLRLRDPGAVETFESFYSKMDNPRERLLVLTSIEQQAKPLPLELIDILLKDECAAVVLLGIEELLVTKDESMESRLSDLLSKEVDRLLGNFPARDQAQNPESMINMDYLKDILRPFPDETTAMPEPLRGAMQEMEREGWKNPAVGIARRAIEALVDLGSTDATYIFAPLFFIKSPILQCICFKALIRLGDPLAFDKTDHLGRSTHEVVRYIWKSKKIEFSDNFDRDIKMLTEDESSILRQIGTSLDREKKGLLV